MLQLHPATRVWRSTAAKRGGSGHLCSARSSGSVWRGRRRCTGVSDLEPIPRSPFQSICNAPRIRLTTAPRQQLHAGRVRRRLYRCKQQPHHAPRRPRSSPARGQPHPAPAAPTPRHHSPRQSRSVQGGRGGCIGVGGGGYTRSSGGGGSPGASNGVRVLPWVSFGMVGLIGAGQWWCAAGCCCCSLVCPQLLACTNHPASHAHPLSAMRASSLKICWASTKRA